MENTKKNSLPELMESTMNKIREMVDSNEVIGEPIVTADGVTVIPITRLSFGFGSGGGDYGKPAKDGFGGGSAAGVRIDPVAFLVIKDGITRVLPVSVPPVSSVERIVDLVPNVLDRVENFIDKKSKKSEEGIL